MKKRWLIAGLYSQAEFETKESAIADLRAHYTKKECLRNEYDLFEQVWDEENEEWINIDDSFERAEDYCER